MIAASAVNVRKKDTMTKDEAIHKLCSLAYDQVGYKERENNWNKYAEDKGVCNLIGWDVQNQPWCATFCVWLFAECFGWNAKNIMYGCSASCSVQAYYYKDNFAFFPEPQKGDQIFFYASGDINHTGIVVDVSGSTITTVEGNYSDGVAQNTYFTGDLRIAGYGRPNWGIIASDDEDDDPVPVVEERAFRELHYPMGLMIPQDDIKAWQQILVCWGYNLGKWGVDGEFGVITMQRTKALQKRVGITPDGIVGEKTWTEAIKMPL